MVLQLPPIVPVLARPVAPVLQFPAIGLAHLDGTPLQYLVTQHIRLLLPLVGQTGMHSLQESQP